MPGGVYIHHVDTLSKSNSSNTMRTASFESSMLLCITSLLCGEVFVCTFQKVYCHWHVKHQGGDSYHYQVCIGSEKTGQLLC